MIFMCLVMNGPTLNVGAQNVGHRCIIGSVSR